MPRAIVGKWGRSLAIRLPGDIVKAARIGDGERVEIEAHDGDIVIRRAQPRFTLTELFQGRTSREWRDAYADAYEWGTDRGREIVEE